MKAFGAFEAKTHSLQLQKKADVVVDAIQKLRILRKGVTLGKKLSIKILKEEGRKR